MIPVFKLTRIDILLNNRIHRTPIHLLNRLHLQPRLQTIKQTRRIQYPLQTIPLPPKHIIRMIRIPRRIAETPHPWTTPIARPLLIIKNLRVPQHFKHNLRRPDRMAFRACPVTFEGSGFGV